MSLVSTSGIRGPVGQTVTADLALDLGRVIACRSGEQIVVGHDARETSEWLLDGLTAGLRSCGADVINIGLVATPTLARSVSWVDADMGVMVTASHNPAEYNGFKLIDRSGRGVPPEEIRALVDAIDTTAYEPAGWNQAGSQQVTDRMGRRHVEAITTVIDPLDDIEVVVDVGNGAGGVTIDALRSLGAHVIPLNEEPDGRFPNRPSEPAAEHCGELQDTVANTGAVLGIALDGDADRMQAVTESGTFVQGDVLLGIFAEHTAEAGDRIVAPINTSHAVDVAVEEMGVTVSRTAIGDTHVAAEATAPDVVFGGEPSGAWIWPDQALCADGPFAACRLASLVDKRGSLDELITEFETYPLQRENVSVDNKHDLMDEIEPKVLQDYGDRCLTVNGVFVDFDDGWFLIRPSGTEPLLRVTAEAETDRRTTELLEHAGDYIEDARGS